MSLAPVIDATREAVRADPANAEAQFRTESTLVGVTEVDVRVGSHTFKVDEPTSLGGTGVAANPVELALAALGSCQAITYRFWADKLGVEIDHVSVRVDGDLDVRGFFGFDDDVRPGFTGVHVTVELGGPESEDRYRDLAQQVDEHCPVLDIFTNPVPVERTIAVRP